MPKKIEILAPAGSYKVLVAAVSAGADAVYFGGQFFNARHGATNFNLDELVRGIEYCQKRRVKSHIVVNTLISDKESEEFFKYIEYIYAMGADAVIVQDLGVFSWLRQVVPKLPVHVSTQMSVNSLSGARMVKELGAKRVVLARELSINEISNISHQAGIETEVFVHGAMCVSYSGQCLISSFIGGRSANRGRCAQPCRLKYHEATDVTAEKKTILSMKDLILLNDVDALRKAGVASLKIEGRMKGEAYVSQVISAYRRAVDGEPVNLQDLEKLKKTFDRGGYSTGYLYGGEDMFINNHEHDPYKTEPVYIKQPELLEVEFPKKRAKKLISTWKYSSESSGKEFEITAQVYDIAQIPPLIEAGINEIFVHHSLIDEKVNKYAENLICVVKFADVSPDTDSLIKNGIKRVCVGNIGQIKEFQDKGFEVFGEYTLNIFNSSSIKLFELLGLKRITLAPELMLAQIRDMYKGIPTELIGYGRIPIMTTKNRLKGDIIDRTSTKFPVIGHEILNSKPIYMADKLLDIETSGVQSVRLVFTTESEREVRDILSAYRNGTPCEGEFTRGRYFKGV